MTTRRHKSKWSSGWPLDVAVGGGSLRGMNVTSVIFYYFILYMCIPLNLRKICMIFRSPGKAYILIRSMFGGY